MTVADPHKELSIRLFASLRRTGVNFIFVWLVALGGLVALSFTSQPWLLWALSAVLAVLFCAVCLPNIGRTVALYKMHGGFDRAFRLHVVLADAGACGTLYAVVALWWPLPFAFAGLVVGFVAALFNSLVGSGSDA
ncbi:hypothetical protein [Polaromonas aquatica]|uniref:hypothetical protein n=1 Tax=Polaromonas aquatica TaxID=332657 RepID=UPI003D6494C4